MKHHGLGDLNLTRQYKTKQNKTKQGITNTLALPIDKDVVHLPTHVHTLNTQKNPFQSKHIRQ
jgi:hypothetical protein